MNPWRRHYIPLMRRDLERMGFDRAFIRRVLRRRCCS